MKQKFSSRPWFFAPRYVRIIVRCECFSGARTALSACSCRIDTFARTKLSALLWLRLCRTTPMRLFP